MHLHSRPNFLPAIVCLLLAFNSSFAQHKINGKVSLDEVVVTDYTFQKIKEIIGSVAVIKPKVPGAIPAGTNERILTGRVAGLSLVTTGGPCVPASIRLHGIESPGGVKPLYIVDGIESNIDALNPYDIESIRVLMDDGAYSIYGVRDANGVIVITTRKSIPQRLIYY